MKKAFLLNLLFCLAFYSCDDGDMIVTDFDFDSDSQLQLCENGPNKVVFVINTNPDEAIAINFSDDDFDGTFEENEEQQILEIPINQTNQLVYRSFEDRVGQNYFCSSIPATEPAITNEYRSTDGGKLYLTTTVIEEETDSLSQIVTKTFQTYAEVRDITLQNTQKEEEIVRESLKIGSFTKERTFNVEN